MRQRVMIAMAIANEPEVLIADEPTTALDVTVQAQILEVIAAHPATSCDTAIVLITHDLGVVARVADRVQVMYAGRVGRARRRRRRSSTSSDPPVHRGSARVAPGAAAATRLVADPGCAAEHAAPAAGLRVRARAARTPSRRLRRAICRSCGRSGRPRRRACGPTSWWHEACDCDRRRSVRRRAGPRGAPTSSSSSTVQRREGIRAVEAIVQAVSGVSFTVERGRDARSGGRVRLGQDHGRAVRAAPARADVRVDQVPRAGAHRRSAKRACGRCAARCRSSSRIRTRRSTRA